MKYSVVIERRTDGKRVECPQSFDWDDEDDATLFYWTDGNMACDCNRKVEFERAEGRTPEPKAVSTCSQTDYRVIEYRLDDGRVIPGMED